jgi:hypothetical protein
MSWKDDVRGITKDTTGSDTMEPIVNGIYQCEITRAIITDEYKGEPVKPYIDLELIIQDGPYKKRRLWPRMYLSEKAYPITVRIIETAGYTIDSPEDLEKALEHMVSEFWYINIVVRPNPNKPDKPYVNVEGFTKVDEPFPF